MKRQILLKIAIVVLLLTASDIFAQDVTVKAKSLEGTWPVITVKHGDMVIDESMIAEAGGKMFIIIKDNIMTMKLIQNGGSITESDNGFEVVGNTLRLDDGELIYYHLNGGILILTNSSDGKTADDGSEPETIICKKQ
jgi:hypothetical protein